ncbi:osmoprotectant transport system permease protein [Crossiella equi]|uniref:Osmoprotectant transport system permease protein n=1 Tax=Crossiella equi TaxID=130796 RepID=A0ABS5AFU0_9PSEU|nr:osmoprotectant transport system permease protein [Crossiella equi]
MFGDLGKYLSSPANQEEVLYGLLQHVLLSLVPVLIGLLLAIPLGWVAQRTRVLRTLFLGTANIVYTVPSLALFVVIPGLIGTRITDPVNVVVALTVYTTALLVRPVIEALDALPTPVLAAATAIGFRPVHRFFTVDLPLSVPVLTAGVRVASVSNISLVSVGALIGVGGLGVLFTNGFSVQYLPPIVVGIVLTLLLAALVDLGWVALRRLLTPWTRVGVGGAP